MDVPGVVRSVKAPDGGADIESTMRSLGDTVCWLDACSGAGSLMDSKWVLKFIDPSKKLECASGAEGKSLKSNILSEESEGEIRDEY